MTASKAVIVDSNKDIASFRNITTTGTVTGGSVVADNITIDGNTISSTDTNGNINITPNGTGAVAFTTNATFGDNDKANFGAGNDLQIYHNGSASIIQDVGSGDLFLAGDNNVTITNSDFSENKAKFISNGGAVLYYNNNSTVTVTSTGIDVTGTVTADGVESTCAAGDGNLALQAYHPTSTSARDIAKFQSDVGGTQVDQMIIGCDGNVDINGTVTADGLTVDSNGGGLTFSGGGNTFISATSSPLIFQTASGTERMRITGTGRVGIGGTSPSQKFVVTNAGADNIVMAENSSASIQMFMQATSSTGSVGTLTNHPVQFLSNNTERMRLTSGGNVGIGVASPSQKLDVDGNIVTDSYSLGAGNGIFLRKGFESTAQPSITVADHSGSAPDGLSVNGNDGVSFRTSNTERARFDESGRLLVAKTTAGSATAGFEVEGNNGATLMTRSQLTVAIVNRLVTDGTLMEFRHANTAEGSISVSGTTVSYNGGHLARWSQATDGNRITGLVKGTVMTNLDQMAEWSHAAVAATYYTADDELPDGVSVGDEKTPAVAAYDEDNEQLNCMAVSSVEGDANVAGVFVNWDDDDTDFTADMNIAMTGDMVIRIAQGTTVTRGDLLMSAGDGTAKPQGDDIVRSKTIAKVTSTTVSHTYDDGSYLVPCVLMAC